MNETMEDLEGICDDVANAIDDAVGEMTLPKANEMVDTAVSASPYEREQFDEMFENLYCCDIANYLTNSIDDAKWTPAKMIDIEPTNDLTLGEAENLGIVVLDDDWD